MQRERCRQTANAATGDDYWMIHCGLGLICERLNSLAFG